MMKLIRKLSVAVCLCGMAAPSSQGLVPKQALNYSYLYFKNGYPTRLKGRRSQNEANLVARANPDLIFQTGYYSLMLDCVDMQLKGYDALAGTDYRTALDQPVTEFTPVSLTLRVIQAGVEYTCSNAVVQGTDFDNVRLIESGQYLKRIDHLGLVFNDANGNALSVDDDCRLEIAAWPDRVTFLLDFSSETNSVITRTMIEVNGHTIDSMASRAQLCIQPHMDSMLADLNPSEMLLEATNLQDDSSLNVYFDADVHALHIDVPADKVSYPAATNRLDEYLFEVTNSTSSVENTPLVFEQPSVRTITGTVMMLCDAEDGRPLGIPVQISKNWHRTSVDGVYMPTVNDGPWLRGSTMLTLEPGESRRFKLRVIYGYWNGAGAVSHAQLSLIGWNCNWKWDESALGAWGESFTYDPTLHAGAAFMDDIRPSFTTSYGSNPTHGWTENVGGGEFLVYRDSANIYRWLKQIKTCYYQTGPNMTEVLYSGVTDDDKIRATYTSRAVSTLDYHRRFHDYKYEFLQDVITPERLVFHQMAADYYMTVAYTNYMVGDLNGLLMSESMDAGGNTYKDGAILFDGKWLCIDDVTGNSGADTARSVRGLIPLSSTLNGSDFPLYIHKYGRSWGDATMLFDLSSDAMSRSYSAGDVIEGELEFIMPPQHTTNYWGGDAELIGRLDVYGDANWEPVRDEFVHNVHAGVTVHHGVLQNSYPLEILPEQYSSVLADFSVEGGGVGHVPVSLKSAEPDLQLKVQRYSDGAWIDYEAITLEENTYYQAILNADNTMDYSFSIPRPSLDLEDAWRVRIVAFEFQQQDEFPDQDVIASQLQRTHAADFRYNGATGGLDAGIGQSFSMSSSQSLRAITIQKNGDLVMPSGTHQVNLWVGEYDSMTDVASHVVGRTLYEAAIDISGQTFTDGSYYTLNLSSNITLNAGVEYAFQFAFDTLDTNHVFGLQRYYEGTGGMDVYSGGSIVYQQNLAGAVPFQSLIDEPENELVFALHASHIGMAPSYSVWAAGYGLEGDDSLSKANPDGDPSDNLYEYAQGGNPTNASDMGYLPQFTTQNEEGAAFVEYIYARRINSGLELDYYLELTSDLMTGRWTRSEYTEGVEIGPIDLKFEAVTNRIETAGKAQEFIRLIIDERE